MATTKKVPTIPAGWNYGQFGTWKNDFGAYLSRNEMTCWSSLVVDQMPDEYPPEVSEMKDAEARKASDEYLRYKHKFGIEDKWSFEANSEKAWGCLYEATRNVPELNV